MLKRMLDNWRRFAGAVRVARSVGHTADVSCALFRDFFGSLRSDQLNMLMDMLDVRQKFSLMELLNAVVPIEAPQPVSSAEGLPS